MGASFFYIVPGIRRLGKEILRKNTTGAKRTQRKEKVRDKKGK
jgi:hypothetical protein